MPNNIKATLITPSITLYFVEYVFFIIITQCVQCDILVPMELAVILLKSWQQILSMHFRMACLDMFIKH